MTSTAPVPAGQHDLTLTSRFTSEDEPVYLTGVQALVRVLLDQARIDIARGRGHAGFVSGYEGSPLAGFDLELGRQRELLEAVGVVHRSGVNEELAATAVQGTQLAGGPVRIRDRRVRGITGYWYGKAPGLDRASDAIRHATMAGTSPDGGVVALVGDDPAAKSSTLPCSSELELVDLQLPTVYPADSADALLMSRHAVEISRASGLWAAMKVSTSMADGATTALAPGPSWEPPSLSALPPSMAPYRHRPHARLIGQGLADLEQSMWEVRLPVAQEYVRSSGLNQMHGNITDARIGVVAAGKTWLDLRQALTRLGLTDDELERRGIRLLKLGWINPVEPTVVRAFARGLEEILVVEEKRSYLEQAVRNILYGTPDAPRVVGKRDTDGSWLLPAAGELGPDLVATALARRFAPLAIAVTLPERPRERRTLPLLPRTPYFCSGCPHNSSTKVPDGFVVGAGIGCSGMVVDMPDKQTGEVLGMTQMGGEGAHWLGLSEFVDGPHYVQNIGDGTFAHSGSLAVRAAVAAGVTMTYKVLSNSAVAMTGGQEVIGGTDVSRIVGILLVEGVRRVVVTTDDVRRTRAVLRRGGVLRDRKVSVRHRDELVEVQQELAEISGVTAMVHDQECATELRRKRKRKLVPQPAERVVINERICEGCGDCGTQSNCVSVHPVTTPLGRKTQIHQSSCNLDYSCLKGDCPSFITVHPGSAPTTRPTPSPRPSEAAPPEPEHRVPREDFAIRITGIGGTGVVTIAQILATAGHLDGLSVRSLDQTGVAQKGGAVVSDLKFSTTGVERSAKLARQECDLYLVCDSLTGASQHNLGVADPGRTIAVVNTAEVPTGTMVVDTTVGFPARAMVEETLRDEFAELRLVDAANLASARLGSEQLTNMVLVGAAYQAGALPLSEEAVLQAIRLNGVAVQANIDAFALGRDSQVHGETSPATSPTSEPASTVPGAPDPGQIARLLAGVTFADEELRAELARLVPELVAYQDARLAASYLDVVRRVAEAESRIDQDGQRLSVAAARYLYKLLAYKDEYEVARLALDEETRRRIETQFGAGAKAYVRLHPPVLRALGLKRKLALGPWVKPVLRALYGMRRVRGTRWDPFGWAHVRRVERRLAADYVHMLDQVIPVLDETNLDAAVRLASLPDLVRGYERIKLDSVAAYRRRVDELWNEIDPAHGTSSDDR